MLGYPSAGTKTAKDRCNIVNSIMSQINYDDQRQCYSDKLRCMHGYCECNYICDAYIQTNINLSEHKYCVMHGYSHIL